MKLFYRKYGEGYPLIILHGLYGCSDNWVSIGKELAKTFQVFIPDIRNHGKSPHSNEHNYEVMTNDLIEFMNFHSIEKAVLLGHSMGGKIIMNFSVRYPERIEKMIILDIAPKTYSFDDDIKSDEHRKVINALLNFDIAKFNNRKDIAIEFSKADINDNYKKFLLKNIYRDNGNHFLWKINIKAINENLQQIMNGLEQERNFSNSSNCLFIKAENSNYILENDYALIKKIFTNSQITTIKNASHWLHIEYPKLIIQKILDFTSNQI
ncbi:MAG: alpha/beta fold hydrolase [Bacteroidetes bacterium]|nr:alpha/beta fold hydrolase [Bacteroidota bacterium]